MVPQLWLWKFKGLWIGVNSMAEQLAARHEFIDINKVGIFGHSGGGLCPLAMAVHPDFYKVDWASLAGNHDNSIYNSWWSESHHGVEN